jgi:poly(3-hydroxyalkanoate) synthetase
MDSFVPPSSQFFEGFEAINPSTPVLFVNNPGDPVTPRSAAYNMQRLFNGSTVFIHNSPGHGISNAPSNCTDAIIAAYFADATLPEYDTWCEADVEANYFFGGPDPKEETSE